MCVEEITICQFCHDRSTCARIVGGLFFSRLYFYLYKTRNLVTFSLNIEKMNDTEFIYI